MADTNIIVSGNLASAPELAFSQAGKPWVKFTIMVNERKEVNGQWQEVAKNGMRCVAFGDIAENIAESFPEGKARVIATGRLVPQQWQDRETGANRYDWQLQVDDLGPSVKWATAKPVKTQRGQGGGQSFRPSPQGEQWNAAPQQPAPQQGGWPQTAQPGQGFDGGVPF